MEESVLNQQISQLTLKNRKLKKILQESEEEMMRFIKRNQEETMQVKMLLSSVLPHIKKKQLTEVKNEAGMIDKAVQSTDYDIEQSTNNRKSEILQLENSIKESETKKEQLLKAQLEEAKALEDLKNQAAEMRRQISEARARLESLMQDEQSFNARYEEMERKNAFLREILQHDEIGPPYFIQALYDRESVLNI